MHNPKAFRQQSFYNSVIYNKWLVELFYIGSTHNLLNFKGKRMFFEEINTIESFAITQWSGRVVTHNLSSPDVILFEELNMMF